MRSWEGILEKRNATCENGKLGYCFVIMGAKKRVIATSRVFRNEAWYDFGLRLFAQMPQAVIIYQSGRQWLDDVPWPTEEHIIIKHEYHEPEYRFEYLSSSGKVLVTSITCTSESEIWRVLERTIMAASRVSNDLAFLKDDGG